MHRIRNEKGEVKIDTAEIQRIMRDYYNQLYANKMDNLKEMEKFIPLYLLHSYTLMMKNLKVKLRKHSHLPLQKKNKISRNKPT